MSQAIKWAEAFPTVKHRALVFCGEVLFKFRCVAVDEMCCRVGIDGVVSAEGEDSTSLPIHD
jgi:hypothetical protein